MWRVVDCDVLRDRSDGLVLMMADIGDASLVDELLGIFGENLTFELRSEDLEPVYARWPQVRRLAVCPVSFLDKEGAEAFLAFRNKGPEYAPILSEEYFKSPEEVAATFPNHPEWIENVCDLVDSIEPVEIVPRRVVKASIPSSLTPEHFACVPKIRRGKASAWDVEMSAQVVVSSPAAITDCGIPVEKFLDGSGAYFTHFTEEALRGMGLTLVDLGKRQARSLGTDPAK